MENTREQGTQNSGDLELRRLATGEDGVEVEDDGNGIPTGLLQRGGEDMVAGLRLDGAGTFDGCCCCYLSLNWNCSRTC